MTKIRASPCASSRALRWLAPSPCSRRLSLIPTCSMSRRALTLPSPGSDSSTDWTFIFPTVSSESALFKSSSRDNEPIFSFSLTSARSRRTLAALSSAAWRCSAVSAGGCGMAATLAPALGVGTGQESFVTRYVRNSGPEADRLGPPAGGAYASPSAAATSSRTEAAAASGSADAVTARPITSRSAPCSDRGSRCRHAGLIVGPDLRRANARDDQAQSRGRSDTTGKIRRRRRPLPRTRLSRLSPLCGSAPLAKPQGRS